MQSADKKNKSIEELRNMECLELASHFNIPIYAARGLVSGLKPGYYEVLIDNSFSAEEMAEKLGVSVKTANSYRSGLLACGLAKSKKENIQIDNVCELILEKLSYPMTYPSLEKITQLNHDTIQKGVRCLEIEDKVYRLNIKGSYELFGNVLRRTYFYKHEQKSAVAQLIIDNIPKRKELESDLRLSKSRTYHLKKQLPTDIYDMVAAYYKTKEDN